MKYIHKNILLIIIALVVISNSYAQESQDKTLKIMTYNIWNGFDWGKDTSRKANFIAWLKKQKPDVLALQELCGYDEQKLKEDALEWGHPYVQLLKTDGYPTALTSNKPIKLKERTIDEFWHGMLHCESYGIDFFIVHLSPFDCNIRLDEARKITERIHKLNNDAYIILGDFNAHSPIDAQWMEKNNNLKTKYLINKNYSNLRLGEFDYSVLSEFLSSPSVDVCHNKIDLQRAYTFPTPVLIGRHNNTPQSVVQNRERIDYILASPKLGKLCVKAEVFNKTETHMFSDHYPVIAEFKIDN